MKPAVPANSQTQVCPHCQNPNTVTELELLARALCGNCGAEFVVSGDIAHFRVTEVCGRGTMGVVYRGVDLQLNQPVVIKVLHPRYCGDPQQIASLETETTIIASVNHPNILRVHQSGIDQGRFFIAMEPATHGSLQDFIQSVGQIGEAQVLDIAIQVARALQAASRFSLVHRDVRPTNIFFSQSNMVKVADFGVAALDQQRVQNGLPEKSCYVAPETLSHGVMDSRSDIYGLGATMYHALVGHPPFSGKTGSLSELVTAKAKPLPDEPPELSISIPTWRMIGRMLKDATERYQAFDELIGSLESAKYQLGSAHPTVQTVRPTATDLPSQTSPKPVSWVPFAAGAILVVLVACGLLWKNRVASPAREAATPVVQTSWNLNENTGFRDATRRLGAGQNEKAAQAFHALANATPPQPALNWITIGEGLSELALGHNAKANEHFQQLAARGLYASDIEHASLAAFFFQIGQRVGDNSSMEPNQTLNFEPNSGESLGFLLFGIKKWQSGRAEDAAGLFKQFSASQFSGEYTWMEDLKPMALQRLEQFEAIQPLVAQYRQSSNLKEKVKLADELKKLEGPLGLYVADLTGSLANEIAQQLDGMAKPVAPPPPTSEIQRAKPSASTGKALRGNRKGSLQPGTYKLVNQDSARFMEVKDAAREEGAHVRQNMDKHTPNQYWTFTATGDGAYTIQVMHSGMAIEGDRSQAAQAEIHVVQYPQSDSEAQEWNVVETGQGVFKIVSRSTGKVLSVIGSSKLSGAFVVLQPDRDEPRQHWQFIPVDDSR